jgi:hypothetical protein
MNNEEMNYMFYVNSVARYSSAYWVYEKLNPNSPWIQISIDIGGNWSAKQPPDWVFEDIWATWGRAILAPTPLTALAGGAIGSAIFAIRKNLDK